MYSTLSIETVPTRDLLVLDYTRFTNVGDWPGVSPALKIQKGGSWYLQEFVRSHIYCIISYLHFL